MRFARNIFNSLFSSTAALLETLPPLEVADVYGIVNYLASFVATSAAAGTTRSEGFEGDDQHPL